MPIFYPHHKACLARWVTANKNLFHYLPKSLDKFLYGLIFPLTHIICNTCTYMICKKYGVEAKSFAIDRIPAQWKDKEPKEVRAELSKMRTAMSDIHSRVSEEIYRQQQERSVDRSR